MFPCFCTLFCRYNLDSLKPAPIRIGEFYLDVFLHHLIEQGYSVFIVASIHPGQALPLYHDTQHPLNSNQFYLTDTQIDGNVVARTQHIYYCTSCNVYDQAYTAADFSCMHDACMLILTYFNFVFISLSSAWQGTSSESLRSRNSKIRWKRQQREFFCCSSWKTFMANRWWKVTHNELVVVLCCWWLWSREWLLIVVFPFIACILLSLLYQAHQWCWRCQ